MFKRESYNPKPEGATKPKKPTPAPPAKSTPVPSMGEGISEKLTIILFRSWAERLDRIIGDLQAALEEAGIDLPRSQEWEYAGDISAPTEFERTLKRFNIEINAAMRPLDAEETEFWHKVDTDFMILDDLNLFAGDLWDAIKRLEDDDGQ